MSESCGPDLSHLKTHNSLPSTGPQNLLDVPSSLRTSRHVCSVAQSCPALCNSMDCSPPGSSVHGISQASILRWVAISFSKGSSQPRNRTWVAMQVLHCRRVLYLLSHWGSPRTDGLTMKDVTRRMIHNEMKSHENLQLRLCLHLNLTLTFCTSLPV